MKIINVYTPIIYDIRIHGRRIEYDELEDEMKRFVNKFIKDYIEYSSANLAYNMHNDSVKKISLTAEEMEKKSYCKAVCQVDDDFTNIDELKKFLFYQYIDGWGESIEEPLFCGKMYISPSVCTVGNYNDLLVKEERN